MRFLYKHFVCDQDELQGALTLRGEEGWRLHTCEPVILQGQYGSGTMSVFVVMDQAYNDEEEVYEAPETAPEGIAMKG